MVWVVLVTWYISYAGGSWNWSGQCSFGLFNARKQAYLVVLTVNVIVVFLLFMMSWKYFFFFLAACFLWVKAAQTSGWPGLIQSWCKHLLTVFFLSNVYCQWWMYLFLVLPSPLQKNLLSVWDGGRGRTPFFIFILFFRFEDFKLRIKNETQNIAINHNLWSWPFCGRTDFIFSNSKKMVYGLFNIFFQLCLTVCRVFISCDSLWVFLFAHVMSWVLTEWLHTRAVEL